MKIRTSDGTVYDCPATKAPKCRHHAGRTWDTGTLEDLEVRQ